MNEHCQMILDQYRSNLASYEKIREYVTDKLRLLINNEGMLVTAIEARVKTEGSLAGKLELKGGKYASIFDITDIVGARVITFYKSEVDKVAALVEQNFNIDWDNSVDKRKMLEPDRFGYMSLHYICSIPESEYFDPEHPEINRIRFEIQMRTTLQHIWASAYHDTGYKSDVEVPVEYIRALSRLAGVLEIADEQFDSIITNLADYRRKVSALVKGGKFDDLSLDGDTFKSYIEIDPFARLNEQIAAINKAEIRQQSYAPYLEIFKWMGFKTLGDLERLKADYSDAAYQMAALQISGTDLDILASTIGIQNLCIVYIIKNGMGEAGLKKFYDYLYGEKPRNLGSAQRTIAKAKSINIV